MYLSPPFIFVCIWIGLPFLACPLINFSHGIDSAAPGLYLLVFRVGLPGLTLPVDLFSPRLLIAEDLTEVLLTTIGDDYLFQTCVLLIRYEILLPHEIAQDNASHR